MFKCDKCGICCRNLNNTDIYKDLDRGDGVCKYLKDNLCSIYEHRPDKCSIDRAYELYFSDLMKLEEFYEINYKACENLKKNFHEKRGE